MFYNLYKLKKFYEKIMLFCYKKVKSKTHIKPFQTKKYFAFNLKKI